MGWCQVVRLSDLKRYEWYRCRPGINLNRTPPSKEVSPHWCPRGGSSAIMGSADTMLSSFRPTGREEGSCQHRDADQTGHGPRRCPSAHEPYLHVSRVSLHTIYDFGHSSAAQPINIWAPKSDWTWKL